MKISRALAIYFLFGGGLNLLSCESHGHGWNNSKQGLKVIVDEEVLIFMPSESKDKEVQLSHAAAFCESHNIVSSNCPTLLVISSAQRLGDEGDATSAVTKTYLKMFYATGDLNAAGLAGFALCNAGNYQAADVLLRAASGSDNAFVAWKASLNLNLCLSREGRYREALFFARRSSELAHSAPEIVKREPKKAMWDSDFSLMLSLMRVHGPKVAREEAQVMMGTFQAVQALWPFQLWFAVLNAHSEQTITEARGLIARATAAHNASQVSTALHKAGVCVPLDLMLDDKKLLSDMLRAATSSVPSIQSFYPASFVLPLDIDRFHAWVERNPGKNGKMLIAKPVHASDGEGIFLTNASEVLAHDRMGGALNQSNIGMWDQGTLLLQEYVTNPQTIDGFKFDLRIFVSVLSLVPLRVHVHNEGYAKFAPKKYSTSKCNSGECLSAHITNSHSPYRDMEETCDMPRTMSQILAKIYPDDLEFRSQVQQQIGFAAQTTMEVAAMAAMKASFNGHSDHLPKQSSPHNGLFCVPGKTYGFDFLLDDDGGVWLLEINSSPGPFYGGLGCAGDPPADQNFLQRWMDIVLGVPLSEGEFMVAGR